MPSSTDHANALVGSIATIMRTARSAESSLMLLDLRIVFLDSYSPPALWQKKKLHSLIPPAKALVLWSSVVFISKVDDETYSEKQKNDI